jgi:flavin-dependent thymidylate synthase
VHNTVSILGWYGSDKTHCLSAWQSTAIDFDEEILDINNLFEKTVKTKKKSAEELLKFLADNEHHTPFEKSTLHFQVRADIATHIHFLKHRIGVSINTESARYKELKDKWYIPDDWKEINQPYIDKFSACKTWADLLENYSKLGVELYHKACEELTPLLGRSRAKESARYFLQYNKQIDFDIMFNFRSFIHFLNLRKTSFAQKEIKDLSCAMLDLVKNLPENPFYYSLKAFGYEN